jgi:hypothetical protein
VDASGGGGGGKPERVGSRGPPLSPRPRPLTVQPLPAPHGEPGWGQGAPRGNWEAPRRRFLFLPAVPGCCQRSAPTPGNLAAAAPPLPAPPPRLRSACRPPPACQGARAPGEGARGRAGQKLRQSLASPESASGLAEGRQGVLPRRDCADPPDSGTPRGAAPRRRRVWLGGRGGRWGAAASLLRGGVDRDRSLGVSAHTMMAML